MSSLSNQNLIEMKNIIAEISLQAAKIIMKNINSPIEIKRDNTPVTKADKESDKIINTFNLVSREEFEVLKKIVQKQDAIIKKIIKSKKTKKAKKL